MDRRHLLKLLGTTTAFAGLSRAELQALLTPGGTMPLQPLGVQLYTVRLEMENGVEQTLERVAAIGYEEVEFAGYFDHSPTEIREMLARTGLHSPAAHIQPAFETDAWARILDDANEAGHEYVVVASVPQRMRADLDGWRRTADAMTGAGERARAACRAVMSWMTHRN